MPAQVIVDAALLRMPFANSQDTFQVNTACYLKLSTRRSNSQRISSEKVIGVSINFDLLANALYQSV